MIAGSLPRVTWQFLLTSLVVCVAPGTGALYTVGLALARGARTGLLAATAGTLGVLPHMLAAVTGLAALLQASGLAFAVVKYAGVAYLLWLAWTTWRDTGTLAVSDTAPPRARSVLWTGVTINLPNPKLTIFFVAFLPQFVTVSEPGALTAMLGLSAVFAAITFAVFAVYALVAATLRDQVLTRPAVMTWVRRVFAGTFVALGARLAFQRA